VFIDAQQKLLGQRFALRSIELEGRQSDLFPGKTHYSLKLYRGTGPDRKKIGLKPSFIASQDAAARPLRIARSGSYKVPPPVRGTSGWRRRQPPGHLHPA